MESCWRVMSISGVTVAPGQRVLRFADTSLMSVELGLPDRLIGKLTPGQEIDVEISALEGLPPFKGRVSEVGVAASGEGRLFRVVIKVPNPDGLLRSGMTARIHVGDATAAALRHGLYSALGAGDPCVRRQFTRERRKRNWESLSSRTAKRYARGEDRRYSQQLHSHYRRVAGGRTGGDFGSEFSLRRRADRSRSRTGYEVSQEKHSHVRPR